jgi:hypothetical protein
MIDSSELLLYMQKEYPDLHLKEMVYDLYWQRQVDIKTGYKLTHFYLLARQ